MSIGKSTRSVKDMEDIFSPWIPQIKDRKSVDINMMQMFENLF